MNASPTVSMVANSTATDCRDTSAAQVLAAVRGGKWRVPVEAIRGAYAATLAATGDPMAAKKAVGGRKRALPGVLWSGTFTQRRADALKTHSGLLVADLDDLAVDELTRVRALLVADEHVFVMFTSPTGTGLKVVYRVPASAPLHGASFRAVAARVRALTGVEIDESGKDMARLCFVSSDPGTYSNPSAVEMKVEAEVVPVLASSNPATLSNGVSGVIRQRIASDLLGAIRWESDTIGFCGCPGTGKHTSGNGPKDCRITLDGVPTVFCVHSSCKSDVEKVNHELRSRVGKAEVSPEEEKLVALAGLGDWEFNKQVKLAARELGVTIPVLRAEVGKRRAPRVDEQPQGSEIGDLDVEPWPEAVDGAKILDEAAAVLSSYVSLPVGAADAIALWALHTHCYAGFEHTPRLNIQSPEKRCGKTTLRDVLALLVSRPMTTEGLTEAVLFRLAEAQAPTYMADEYDTWLEKNDPLRGIINAGHKRGSGVLRCVGDEHEVRKFKVFCPVVLCGIGALPDTIADRSVLVMLKRALQGESLKRFDSRRVAAEKDLCRKFARWCLDNAEDLDQDPPLPDGCYNRDADKWRPLFSIAFSSGGGWPERAAAAYVQLTPKAEDGPKSQGTELLTDIRQVFEDGKVDRMFTVPLRDALVAMPERPWADMGYGRLLTPKGLATTLKDYGIKSSNLRIGLDQKKGYLLDDFGEAFERYIPARFSTHPKNDDSIRPSVPKPCLQGFADKSIRPTEKNGTDEKAMNPLVRGLWDAGTDENTEIAQNEKVCGKSLDFPLPGGESDDWKKARL